MPMPAKESLAMSLTELQHIRLPVVPAERGYSTRVLDRQIAFDSLKAVLGAADISKAGDLSLIHI